MKQEIAKRLLTDAEKQQITSWSADGWTPYKIAKHLGRSAHTIARYLKQPEVVAAVKDEKAELSRKYQDKAKVILETIDGPIIQKAGLKDRAIASGICLDKSLALSGEQPSINLVALLDVAELLRSQERGETPSLPKLPALPPPEHES